MTQPYRRRGGVAIIVALSITVLLMFAALAIDFTFLVTARMRAQTAVDAAAHAGMVALTRSDLDGDYATTVAQALLERNGVSVGDIELGAYDFDSDTFTTSTVEINAIRVSADVSEVLERDLFLAPLLGMPLSDRSGKLSATSAIQPREIMFVLDQSCSMSTGAKIASAKEGVLKALDTVLATDPNGMDHVGLVGFGDAGTLHSGLTRLSTNYSTVYDDWNNGICLCTMTPFIKYYAEIFGGDQSTAQTYDLNTGTISDDALHPLSSGDSHYGREGHTDVTFRCCEPHCDEDYEAEDPDYDPSDPGGNDFFPWLSTYYHGNGALWGMQEAMAEYQGSGMTGSHRVMIVLGDGIDFCPSDSSDMPEPCASGGDILATTVDYAEQLWEEEMVHIYPIYYGDSDDTYDYYESLAQGDGRIFNPQTPAELEDVFAEIVARSQVALVQ